MYHIDGFVECPIVLEHFNEHNEYEWSHPVYIQLRDRYASEQTDATLARIIHQTNYWLYRRFTIHCYEIDRIVNGNTSSELLHAIEQCKYRVSQEFFYGCTTHVMNIRVYRTSKNMSIQLLLAPHEPISNTLSGMTVYQLIGTTHVK